MLTLGAISHLSGVLHAVVAHGTVVTLVQVDGRVVEVLVPQSHLDNKGVNVVFNDKVQNGKKR